MLLRDTLEDIVAVLDDVELPLSVVENVVDFENVFERDIDTDAVVDCELLGDTEIEKDPLLLAIAETEPLMLIVRKWLGDIEHVTEAVQLELEVIVDVGTSVLVWLFVEENVKLCDSESLRDRVADIDVVLGSLEVSENDALFEIDRLLVKL